MAMVYCYEYKDPVSPDSFIQRTASVFPTLQSSSFRVPWQCALTWLFQYAIHSVLFCFLTE